MTGRAPKLGSFHNDPAHLPPEDLEMLASLEINVQPGLASPIPQGWGHAGSDAGSDR